MKRFLGIIVFLAIATQLSAQFDNYFLNKTLRIDYIHAGNDTEEVYSIDELLIEPYWGGSHINLVDIFDYGKYYFKVYDLESNQLIYSRGYSTLFGEWQTTAEAEQTWRSFTESVVMPYPKKDVRVEFFSRQFETGKLELKFEYTVDVDSYFIKPERRLEFPSFDVAVNAPNEKAVDIVIIPEGYSEAELGIFIQDCKDFAKHLFSFDPYGANKEKFNIRGVLAPSPESGTDIPADSIWKKTLLNTTFYTFDSERYCMTDDFKSVRDLAANAPYDQIYILVNHPKYGGGAIYNYYSVSVNSNALAAKIFIHELGHGFAGLGDEYYNSSVAYSDFYNTNVEPWEPNLTTLVDFESKWKSQLAKGTPIPTDPEDRNQYPLGVYEGGGYVGKGVYRPAYDCLMNSFRVNDFCGCCQTGIQKMIDFYTE